MSACATTVYTTDQTDASLEPEDFTKAIQAASTNEERRTLLAEKQLLHPPRLTHVSSERAEKPDIYRTRNGEDWREILAEKQRLDRIRRRDCVSVADIEVTL